MYSRIVINLERVFDYDDNTREFYDRYLSFLGTTPTGRRGQPQRIRPEECNFRIRVLRAVRWPLVNGEYASGLVVSEKILPHFVTHANDDLQVVPIKIDPPKGVDDPPRYFLLNCLREEDVLNCAESRARNSEDAVGMLDRLALDGEMVIDSSRMPSPRELFVVKYRSKMVLGPKLSAALGAVRSKDFRLEPIRDVPEPEEGRVAILKRLEAELKARSVSGVESETIKTSSALEKLLQVKLPAAVKKYFAEPPEIEDCSTELFDLSRATEETQRLREWKELQWPTELVCISDDGRGGYWALDTSKAKVGDCPVVYFDHELADVDRKTGRITPNLELASPTLRAWLKGLKSGGTGLPESELKGGKAAAKKVRTKAKKKSKKK